MWAVVIAIAVGMRTELEETFREHVPCGRVEKEFGLKAGYRVKVNEEDGLYITFNECLAGGSFGEVWKSTVENGKGEETRAVKLAEFFAGEAGFPFCS